MSAFNRASGDLTGEERIELARLYFREAEQALGDANYIAERSPKLAVSRAYYAEFHAASALLATRGIVRKKHQGVISEFGNEFVRHGLLPNDLGTEINMMQDARIKADYHVEETFSPSEVRDLLDKAKRFVDETRMALEKIDPEIFKTR